MQHDRLAIRLFGDFGLTDSTQTTVIGSPSVHTARLQALLAYLILHRHAPQQRQHLAFLFWPDTSEAQALTNLRNLLHKLRQALPTLERYLQFAGSTIQWRPDAPCTIDVANFETAVATAKSVDELANAVEFYQGDLLPSCYDDWILPERERLRQLAIAALEQLLDQLEAQRYYRRAIRYGQQLLQLEPFNEAVYRRLMHLHAADGDQTGARQVYQHCVAMLQTEFAATPTPATEELYQRLLHHDLTPPPKPQRLGTQPPLVGRNNEWQQLVDSWYRARSGSTHCLLLTGEAGIGKTRLAEELLIWVERQGFITASAHCYAAEGALAYAPVVAWLRTPAVNKGLAALEPVWLTEIARLLPELLTNRPELAPLGPLSAGWQRQRLFEALAHALHQQNRPILLLLDDLQWCDRDTLEWLHYLLRFTHDSANPAMPPRCLLLVGTARSDAMDEHQPLQALLLALRHDDALTEVGLAGLSLTETAALANAVANQPFSAAQSAVIYEETEGNPLFVVEMVQARLGQGDAWVRAAQGDEALAIVPLLPTRDATPLPPKVHAMIQARLADLSPATREVAALAATIGRAFPYAVLANTSQRADDALVQSLDELCQRRIVRERSADQYDFTHDKLREVTYNSLSAARRRLAHKAVAQALEATYRANGHTAAGQSPEAVSGQIASHYELAGLYDQAVDYYQQAAEAAHQLSANRDAIRAYRRALTLSESRTSAQHAPPTELYEQLGDILHTTSQYDEARASFVQALTHAAPDGIQRARLHRKIGSTWREQYEYTHARQFYGAASYILANPTLPCPHSARPGGNAAAQLPVAQHGPALIGAQPQAPAWWEEWLQIQLELDLVHYWLAENEKSAALQAALEPLVEQHGTAAQQAAFFQRRSQLEFRRNRSVANDAAVAYIQRSFARYQASGQLAGMPSAYFMLGFTLLWRDRWEGSLAAATTALQQALQIAEESGDLSLQARCLTYLTIASRRGDQISTAQSLITKALTVAHRAQMPEYEAMAKANEAWVAWRTGQFAAVQAAGQAALALWHELPVTHASTPFQWTALWPLLATALQADELAAALVYAQALLDPHQQQLPTELETLLIQASQTATNSATGARRHCLQQAVNCAQQQHYL